MSKLITQNAYRVLGLDTTAETKEILRRSKEIEHRLGIGDVPEYDFDIQVSEEVRTLETVKEAVQNIQNPKKKIKENFFWFRVVDDVDEQAIGLATRGDYQNAIRVWQNASEGTTINALFYKKNLAVLLCLVLLQEDNRGYLRDSIAIWKELIDSTKFWTQFIKDYEARDDTANHDFLLQFKSQVSTHLADLYADLHELHSDNDYIKEFQSTFSVRGEKIEKAILNPAFQAINAVVEKLEAMKVSEDGIFDKDEKNQIKALLGDLKSELNKLIELGLYDDSQTRIMRDRAASALRSISLDIHNNLDDVPVAEQLLNIANEFVGTAGMGQKVQQDLKTLANNKKFIEKIKPVMDLMNDKRFVEAIALLDKMKQGSNDAEFKAAMDAKKKEAVTLYAVEEFLGGRKLFEAEKYDQASPLLQKSASIVYDHIDIYDVNKEVIDSWLDTIKSNVRVITADNAKDVDDVHNKMLQQIDEAFEERWEQMAIKVLINAYYFVGLGDVIKEKKASNTRSTLISWAVWIGILLVLGAMFG